MNCPQLPNFEVSAWPSVQAAFAHAPALDFGQSWRAHLEADFQKGSVRMGWRGGDFCFYASLIDANILTKATRRNEELYKLGDTFEFFAGRLDQPSYIEYHFSPNSMILQLNWPKCVDELNVKEAGGITTFMREDNDARFAVLVDPAGWHIVARCPGAIFGCSEPSLAGQEWRVSFGRYDYSPDREEPIISSTSPHLIGRFHRLHEWQNLKFV